MTFDYCSILVCNLTFKWSGPCLKLFCSGLCIIDFYAAVLHYQDKEQCTVSEIKGIYLHTCAYYGFRSSCSLISTVPTSAFDPPTQSAITLQIFLCEHEIQ